MPVYQTAGSAAADLCYFGEKPARFSFHERKALPTGLTVEIPEGYVGLIFARSGLALKEGLCLANGVGVIDSDYRGEIKVALMSTSGQLVTVRPGDRIAQLMILPVPRVSFEEAEALSDTVRGEGGFGSTGRV